MLAFPVGFKIHLAIAAVDMRKGFNGLWTEVEQRLRMDPRQGAVYAFSNRHRDRIKLLYWDGSGVWVLAKRLEKGRYTWPVATVPGELQQPVSPELLTMILAGIDLQKTRRKNWNIKN